MSYPKFDEVKDPEDISDFELSYTDSMPTDDVITSVLLSDVEISADKIGDASTLQDVSAESALASGQSAILWLAGGKPGWRYLIGALVQTAGGRTLRRRALLDVKTQ